MKAAVITASDSGYQGKREDKSGPLAARRLIEAGYEVTERRLLPDDRGRLAEALRELADGGDVQLILTTGGTGFSPRDWTPEATMDVVERPAPGIAEAMRAYSMKITGRAMLSRAAAGIRGRTLIVNLPGSPKAVGECLDCILPELSHGLRILTGEEQDCAGKADCARREGSE